jgi:hypothetical protein
MLLTKMYIDILYLIQTVRLKSHYCIYINPHTDCLSYHSELILSMALVSMDHLPAVN